MDVLWGQWGAVLLYDGYKNVQQIQSAFNTKLLHLKKFNTSLVCLIQVDFICVRVVDDRAAVSAQSSWIHSLVCYSIGALSGSVVFPQMFTKTDRTKHNQLIMLIASICSPAAVNSHFSQSQELVYRHSPCMYISQIWQMIFFRTIIFFFLIIIND